MRTYILQQTFNRNLVYYISIKSAAEIKATCTNFKMKILKHCLSTQKVWKTLIGIEVDKIAYRQQKGVQSSAVSCQKAHINIQ